MAISEEIINHIVESTGATQEVDQTNTSVAIAGTDKTVVNYTGLRRYHHQLLHALGLVQDTAEYQYKGSRGRWYVVENGERKYDGISESTEGAQFEYESFEAESISDAVDKIYDLAKSGGVTFAAGKSTAATGEPIMFAHTHAADEADTDKNTYFINAKVGDNTFNIGFDASEFVKDSVLKSVFLLTVEETTAESTTTKTYKANGAEATFGTDEDGKDTLGSFNVAKTAVEALEAGTYFYYTWITDNGEKGKEYQYTSISLKDVYGDISGDGTYIAYDKDTATISANTGKVGTKDVTTITEYSVEVVHASSTAAGSVTVTPPAPEGQEASPVTYAIPAGSTAEAVLRDKGYIVPEGSGDTITSATTSSTTKEWIDVDANGNEVTNAPDALATTDNVKEVASTLQSQIDTLKAGTLTPGDITLDDTIDASEIEVANNKINIKIAVASGDDISALFGACPGDEEEDEEDEPSNDATSIAATSIVNSGNAIFEAGEYTINVGEEPANSNTDITWTKQD